MWPPVRFRQIDFPNAYNAAKTSSIMSSPEEELHIVPSGSLSNGSRVVFRQRPSGGAWSVEDINTGTYGIRVDVS